MSSRVNEVNGENLQDPPPIKNPGYANVTISPCNLTVMSTLANTDRGADPQDRGTTCQRPRRDRFQRFYSRFTGIHSAIAIICSSTIDIDIHADIKYLPETSAVGTRKPSRLTGVVLSWPHLLLVRDGVCHSHLVAGGGNRQTKGCARGVEARGRGAKSR